MAQGRGAGSAFARHRFGGFCGDRTDLQYRRDPLAGILSVQAKTLARRCRDLGLQIPSYEGGGTILGDHPFSGACQRAGALEHAKKALECLAILGGRTLLVVPGRIHPDVPYEDHWKRVVDFAQEAGEIANRLGIVIGLENVEARFPLSVREWNDLLGGNQPPGGPHVSGCRKRFLAGTRFPGAVDLLSQRPDLSGSFQRCVVREVALPSPGRGGELEGRCPGFEGYRLSGMDQRRAGMVSFRAGETAGAALEGSGRHFCTCRIRREPGESPFGRVEENSNGKGKK